MRDLETVPDLSGYAAANNLVGRTDAEVASVPAAPRMIKLLSIPAASTRRRVRAKSSALWKAALKHSSAERRSTKFGRRANVAVSGARCLIAGIEFFWK